MDSRKLVQQSIMKVKHVPVNYDYLDEEDDYGVHEASYEAGLGETERRGVCEEMAKLARDFDSQGYFDDSDYVNSRRLIDFGEDSDEVPVKAVEEPRRTLADVLSAACLAEAKRILFGAQAGADSYGDWWETREKGSPTLGGPISSVPLRCVLDEGPCHGYKSLIVDITDGVGTRRSLDRLLAMDHKREFDPEQRDLIGPNLTVAGGQRVSFEDMCDWAACSSGDYQVVYFQHSLGGMLSAIGQEGVIKFLSLVCDGSSRVISIHVGDSGDGVLPTADRKSVV